MLRTTAVGLILIGLSSEVYAQQIGFDVKDVGVLSHTTHGEGVVIVVQPMVMPEGGIQSPEIASAAGPLCDAFGPRALSIVEEQAGLSDPDFVGVRIISGGMFGQYFFQAYAVVDGGCGEPLD